MARFAVQIEAKDWEGEGGQKKFFLENISESSITKSLTITTHPVIGGEKIADHFYKNPATLNFSGIISLNSNKTEITEGVILGKNNPQELGRFQQIFEKIQSEGLLCDIVKIQRGEDGGYRFRKQDNMVLSSITWTEGINSLGFDMSWTQALIVEQTNFATSSNGGTTGDTDVNNSQVENDVNLPSVESPNLSSFSETAMDWTQVEAELLNELRTQKLLTNDVIEYVVSHQGNMPDLSLAPKKQKKLFAVCSIVQKKDISKAGRIKTYLTNALYGIFARVGVSVVSLFKKGSTQAAIYGNSFSTDGWESMDSIVTRLGEFLWTMDKILVEKYNNMSVYRITSNGAHDVLLQIGNESYTCKFRCNNTTGRWYLDVEKDGGIVAGISDLKSCITDYSQATNSNRLFRADDGNYVHVVRIPSKAFTFDLTNYCLVVSPANFTPDKFNEEIQAAFNRTFKNG